MNLMAILSNIRLPDMLDILFITIISYQFYIWFWGTQAFKALIGIVALSGVFLIANAWGLFLTTWVFQILWQVFVILLIILFQKEIRQILERFNPMKTFGIKQEPGTIEWIHGLVSWAFEAGKKKLGAVIVFERSDRVFELITRGTAMECDLRPEILYSVFNKESPLHDGAILVSNGKIVKVSCYLPLSIREDLPQEWGTRHRAALGLTEQCDAGVLIISEERGDVSFFSQETFQKTKRPEELSKLLADMSQEQKEPTLDIAAKIRSWFTKRYKIKSVIFVSVFILWLIFAGQQNFERTIDLPVRYKSIPANLVISEPADPKITITCRGLRKDVSLLNENNVSSVIDLFSARAGTSFYAVNTGNINLPNSRIQVVNIHPSKIQLTLEKKEKPSALN
ncbi:MAG: diadenylate cyclase [Proteobacteria bacterium]|nr:diadenylate cyclase [Pseudomonadota bacterium]